MWFSSKQSGQELRLYQTVYLSHAECVKYCKPTVSVVVLLWDAELEVGVMCLKMATIQLQQAEAVQLI